MIEGAFSLGWIGRLTPEQLAFVGHLVRNRGNVQKVASDLNIAYNINFASAIVIGTA